MTRFRLGNKVNGKIYWENVRYVGMKSKRRNICGKFVRVSVKKLLRRNLQEYVILYLSQRLTLKVKYRARVVVLVIQVYFYEIDRA